MKIEKNKIVFGGVLLIVVLFIISYSFYIMRNDEPGDTELRNPEVPKLEQQQADYTSKLDAINDLQEKKETNAPSIYDESLIDSLGYYDPDLPEKDKQRIIDSLYSSGVLNSEKGKFRSTQPMDALGSAIQKPQEIITQGQSFISSKEIALDHQLFFASKPAPEESSPSENKAITVIVDGTQKVRAGYRLKMRLAEKTSINNKEIPKNTLVYGFISFKPNRALMKIENIAGIQSSLKAYDLQDKSEGIYVVNNFQARATKEAVGDLVDEINVAGIPQVSGIKKLFQHDNRSISVTILNNYKLILKNDQQ